MTVGVYHCFEHLLQVNLLVGSQENSDDLFVYAGESYVLYTESHMSVLGVERPVQVYGVVACFVCRELYALKSSLTYYEVLQRLQLAEYEFPQFLVPPLP